MGFFDELFGCGKNSALPVPVPVPNYGYPDRKVVRISKTEPIKIGKCKAIITTTTGKEYERGFKGNFCRPRICENVSAKDLLKGKLNLDPHVPDSYFSIMYYEKYSVNIEYLTFNIVDINRGMLKKDSSGTLQKELYQSILRTMELDKECYPDISLENRSKYIHCSAKSSANYWIHDSFNAGRFMIDDTKFINAKNVETCEIVEIDESYEEDRKIEGFKIVLEEK